MEKTPLELYETAYKLHYIDKKIPEAVSFYEQLIKEFPDSNECGYAAIQLQKIKTSHLANSIRKNQKSFSPLTVFSFILACVSLIICGAVTYYFKEQLSIEQKRTTLTISALGKMFRGEDEEALRLLTELKIIRKDDITPFELSADIYRRAHQYQKANEEYELFYRLNTDRQPSKGEINIMENDKVLDEKSKKNTSEAVYQKEKDSVLIEFSTSDNQKVLKEGTDPSEEKKIDTSPVEEKKFNQKKAQISSKSPSIEQRVTSKKTPTSGSSKDIYIVNPDSLSYF